MQILFIDTETGGLNPNKHSLLTIGIVAYDKGINATDEILVGGDTYKWTTQALEVNGIDISDHDRDSLDRDVAKNRFYKFLDDNFEDDIVVGGHNITFDINFVKRLITDFDDITSHRKIDTETVGLALHDKGFIESATLDDSCEYYNINIGNHHNALDDAIASAKLYERFMEGF